MIRFEMEDNKEIKNISEFCGVITSVIGCYCQFLGQDIHETTLNIVAHTTSLFSIWIEVKLITFSQVTSNIIFTMPFFCMTCSYRVAVIVARLIKE